MARDRRARRCRSRPSGSARRSRCVPISPRSGASSVRRRHRNARGRPCAPGRGSVVFTRSLGDLVLHGLTNNRSYLIIAGLLGVLWQGDVPFGRPRRRARHRDRSHGGGGERPARRAPGRWRDRARGHRRGAVVRGRRGLHLLPLHDPHGRRLARDRARAPHPRRGSRPQVSHPDRDRLAGLARAPDLAAQCDSRADLPSQRRPETTGRAFARRS